MSHKCNVKALYTNQLYTCDRSPWLWSTSTHGHRFVKHIFNLIELLQCVVECVAVCSNTHLIWLSWAPPTWVTNAIWPTIYIDIYILTYIKCIYTHIFWLSGVTPARVRNETWRNETWRNETWVSRYTTCIYIYIFTHIYIMYQNTGRPIDAYPSNTYMFR